MKIDQHKIDRFLALLLIVGGVAGLVLAIWLWLQASLASLLLALVFLPLFGLSAWVGVGLWRELPRYHIWAQIAFALQVPIVTCSAFSYKFFTAMVFELSFEGAAESKLNLNWELGSKFSFIAAPGSPDLIIGVNVLALAALAYLLFEPRKSMMSQRQPVPPDGQNTEQKWPD